MGSVGRARAWTLAIAALLFVAAAWAVVVWVEAEKEARILCGMFESGEARDAVIRTLETAKYLRWGPPPGGAEGLLVTAPLGLPLHTCEVELAGGVVVVSRYGGVPRPGTSAGVLAAVLLSALAAFQLLLAAGASLGRFAWGGRWERLPHGLRVASGVSVPILLFAAVCALERGAVIRVSGGAPWVEVTTWVFFLLFFLSTVGNLLSSSPSERRVMTPVAFVLTLAFLALGLGW